MYLNWIGKRNVEKKFCKTRWFCDTVGGMGLGSLVLGVGCDGMGWGVCEDEIPLVVEGTRCPLNHSPYKCRISLATHFSPPPLHILFCLSSSFAFLPPLPFSLATSTPHSSPPLSSESHIYYRIILSNLSSPNPDKLHWTGVWIIKWHKH